MAKSGLYWVTLVVVLVASAFAVSLTKPPKHESRGPLDGERVAMVADRGPGLIAEPRLPEREPEVKPDIPAPAPVRQPIDASKIGLEFEIGNFVNSTRAKSGGWLEVFYPGSTGVDGRIDVGWEVVNVGPKPVKGLSIRFNMGEGVVGNLGGDKQAAMWKEMTETGHKLPVLLPATKDEWNANAVYFPYSNTRYGTFSCHLSADAESGDEIVASAELWDVESKIKEKYITMLVH